MRVRQASRNIVPEILPAPPSAPVHSPDAFCTVTAAGPKAAQPQRSGFVACACMEGLSLAGYFMPSACAPVRRPRPPLRTVTSPLTQLRQPHFIFLLLLSSSAALNPSTASCSSSCSMRRGAKRTGTSSMLCFATQAIGMATECVAVASALADAVPRHGTSVLAALTLTPLAAARRTLLGF